MNSFKKFHHISLLPASFLWIVLKWSSTRLRFSFSGLSGTFSSSFNVFSTKTVWSMVWNFPSLYISHSFWAACSLDNRNVATMEPFKKVLTNTAPWGRCYEEKSTSQYTRDFTVHLPSIHGSLYMSPVNVLSWLPGRILSSVHMGNFSPIDRDEIQETEP